MQEKTQVVIIWLFRSVPYLQLPSNQLRPEHQNENLTLSHKLQLQSVNRWLHQLNIKTYGKKYQKTSHTTKEKTKLGLKIIKLKMQLKSSQKNKPKA